MQQPLVALSRTDLVPPDLLDAWVAEVRRGFPAGVDVLPVSAVARRGLDGLKERLFAEVQRAKDEG